MIPEKGSLGDIPAVRIFISIFEEKETGIISLKKEKILKILYFNDGKFTWGFSDSEGDRLEDILLSRNMVTNHALDELKRKPGFLASPGKVLVENGQITFQQLLDLTREQMRQIFSSVMLWTEGDFRFIRDTPPNRLVLHELEIPQFIYLGLTGKVDRRMVEREIGPLELELIKTTDTEKLNRYPLTPEQSQILEAFDGGERTGTVVSRFSTDDEKTFRLIYFLFLLELLVRKETRPDSSHTRRQEQTREKTDGEPRPNTVSTFSPPADETGRMEKYDAPSCEELPISGKASSRIDRFRFLPITLILVVAIVSLARILTTPTARNQPSPSSTSTPPPEATALQPETEARPANAPPIPNRITSGNESGIPLVPGQLDAAAEHWKRQLKKSPVAYSVFLELDCREESVLDAYDRITRKGDFFIIPRKHSGKNCYLVLWGKFATQDEATAALKEIPPFFFQQQDPPRIVALNMFLEKSEVN